MAALTGSLASVAFYVAATPTDPGIGAANTVLANHWEVTLYKLPVADVTPFSPTSNTRVGLATVCDRATGRMSGFHDSATGFNFALATYGPQQPTPTVVTIRLYINATKYYSFSGHLTGFSASTDVGQPITYSADFESVGPVSFT